MTDEEEHFWRGFIGSLTGIEIPNPFEPLGSGAPLARAQGAGAKAGRDLLATKPGLSIRNKLHQHMKVAYDNRKK